MGGVSKCPNCGGTEVASNDARGERACMQCGTVLEESVMVEGVSFADNSTVVGQYVSFTTGGTAGRGYGSSRESREQVLQRGRSNIQRIADHLRLSTAHQESAHRIFILAAQRSFTVGRPGLYVAAACLYVICRRQKTPHMLIDFSDVLRVPVRTLGRVFVKLVRVLHIPVPEIDPSLFMERYASQMQLEDKTQLVAATGVRLIQAMTRDWISTGRRPTGLCGAALLIAARYHGFKIHAEDMVPIVRISWHTLTRRLYEFRQTSTAALTATEFEKQDLRALPILRGPPCFEAAKRRRLRMEQLQLQDASGSVVVSDEQQKSSRRRRDAAAIVDDELSDLEEEEDIDGDRDGLEGDTAGDRDGLEGDTAGDRDGLSGALQLPLLMLQDHDVSNDDAGRRRRGGCLSSCIDSGTSSSCCAEGSSSVTETPSQQLFDELDDNSNEPRRSDDFVAEKTCTDMMMKEASASASSDVGNAFANDNSDGLHNSRGVVQLDGVNQDLLCSEELTSREIERIAAKMIDAIDKRGAGSSGSVGKMASADAGGDRVANDDVQQQLNGEGVEAKGGKRDCDENGQTQSTADTVNGECSEQQPCTASIAATAMSDEKDVSRDNINVKIFEECQPEVSDDRDGGFDGDDDPLTLLLREVCERSADLLPEFDAGDDSRKESSADGNAQSSSLSSSAVGGVTDVFGDNGAVNTSKALTSGKTACDDGDDQNGGLNVKIDVAKLDSTSAHTKINKYENEETLSDVSESEIADMILSEREQQVKALIWDDMTKEVMPEVHRRMKERKRRERDGSLLAATQRRRRKRESDVLPEAETPADSVRIALEQRASSAAKRLNDAVLDSLFA